MSEPVITARERAYGEAFDRVCRERDRVGVLQASWGHDWQGLGAPGNPEKYQQLVALHAEIVAEAEAAGEAAAKAVTP